MDATLRNAHAGLVTGLDDALDLEAGLARVVKPAAPFKRLAAFADQLATRPAVERLAAHSRLPVDLLVEARDLATWLPDIHTLRAKLQDPVAGRTTLLVVAVRVADGLESSPELLAIARRLVHTMQPQQRRIYSERLHSSCVTRLSSVLFTITPRSLPKTRYSATWPPQRWLT